MAARAAAWGRLLRLSNTPTIPADLLAGFCAGSALGGTRAFELAGFAAALVACLGIYHGALVLNDWLDRAHDARTRPDRPLPSGAIRSTHALAAFAALTALALGGALLAPENLRAPLAALAACAYGYDLLLKRSAFTGPLALGACRALDLSIGVLLAGSIGDPPRVAALLVAYGAYVVSLSGLARMEDGRPRLPAIRAALLFAGACFAAGPILLPNAIAAPFALALGAWIATRGFAGDPTWSRERVARTVGKLLSLLALFSALVAWAAGFELAAITGCALYLLARMLARIWPPS